MSKGVVVSLSYRLGLSNDSKHELVRLYLRQGATLYFFDSETVVLE